MKPNDVMGTAVRLGGSVDALAALVAFVRLETEQIPADPAVRDLLSQIATELVGGDGIAEPAAAAPIVGLGRTFLRQAAEMIENPGRSGGWDQVDVPLLQSMGRLSMAISGAFSSAGRQLPELGALLDSPDGRLLDVGTGAGWLAVALARSRPDLAVVGIDIFEPALDLARQNVKDSGLADRISLRLQDATSLDATDQFDVIWLPLPFLPAGIVESVVAAATRALRPGRLATSRNLHRSARSAPGIAHRSAYGPRRRPSLAAGRDHRHAHRRRARPCPGDSARLGGPGPALRRTEGLTATLCCGDRHGCATRTRC